MKKYTIDKAFWASKQEAMCIGIAEFRLPCNMKIKDKPGRYIITKEFANKYPRHIVENTQIALRIIPIDKLIKEKE